MSFWCHRFDQNSNKNIVRISTLNFFRSVLGASWKLFGASCRLPYIWYYFPRKPPGSYKIFRVEILTIFLLLFWSKRWHQKDISKLTDFYCLNHTILLQFWQLHWKNRAGQTNTLNASKSKPYSDQLPCVLQFRYSTFLMIAVKFLSTIYNKNTRNSEIS